MSDLIAVYDLVDKHVLCEHCGDDCPENHEVIDHHHFCCHGCVIVWQVLQDNGLQDFYSFRDRPVDSFRLKKTLDYTFLDNPEIQKQLIALTSGNNQTIIFDLPSIHCSACVWLLENINRLNPGIKFSRVDFLKRKCTVVYDRSMISLKELASLLGKIGYPPQLKLANIDGPKAQFIDRSIIYKVGVAGFCFGNIMLFSFPDYLGASDGGISSYFGIINIALALPVVFYSGFSYLKSAWDSVRMRSIGIDLPIAMGMLTLFFRSIYDILTLTGPGYLDSLTGFLFFLLIGRWFQNHTFQSISFDRDYKSFFPISVKTWINNQWQDQPIDQIRKGDHILVRNEEIIPCDGEVVRGHVKVDYSFVTGESTPIAITENEIVHSGGKMMGASAVILVKNGVSQSNLTQLWNNDIFKKQKTADSSRIMDSIGQHFTISILVLAIGTLGFWYVADKSKAFQSFTAVLIIACPCVLALSIPFLYGNAVRILSGMSIYCRNVHTLINLSRIDMIVFDKTGTLTDSAKMRALWSGKSLSALQLNAIKSICVHSNHRLSQGIVSFLKSYKTDIVDEFQEIAGKGLIGKVGGHMMRIGSAKLILNSNLITNKQTVYIEINNEIIGRFEFDNSLRSGVEEIISQLGQKFKLAVLSGDNSHEIDRIRAIFPTDSLIRFDQTPSDKLEFIESLRKSGKKVMMIGDGLNDAGAIRASDVGVVISADENNFTPAADLIMSASRFNFIGRLMHYARRLRWALNGAFALAVFYNIIGLGFAITGHLSPIVAAILMPISSFSIMVYGIGVSYVIWALSK